METIKQMLNDAIKYFGTQDIVTIMLSQKLDREIVEVQKDVIHARSRKRTLYGTH